MPTTDKLTFASKTFAGTIAALFPFVYAPVLITLALALWIGFCL